MRASRQLFTAGVAALGVWAGTYEVGHHEAPAFENRAAVAAYSLELGQTATRSMVLPESRGPDFKPAFAYTKTTTTTYEPSANALDPNGNATGSYHTNQVTTTYDLPSSHDFLSSMNKQADKWDSTHDFLNERYWTRAAAGGGVAFLVLQLAGASLRRKRSEKQPKDQAPEVTAI